MLCWNLKCQYGALHRALLKTIFFFLNYSSDLILAIPTFTKTGLESTEQVIGFDNIVKTISKNVFQNLITYDVRLMEQKDATSPGDFPAFSNGMIFATLQMRGQWASEKNELNMNSNSWRTKRPSHLRNEAGMFSGPAAPLSFTFLMADSWSPIWNGAQLSSSTDGALRRFLNCWLRSRSARDLLSLLTISC